jgi:hypothetical protein
MASELRGQRDYVGDAGNYREAYKCQLAIQKVDTKLKQQERRNAQIGKVRELAGKHQELESVVAGYLQTWDREFQEFAKNAEQDGEALRLQQEKELDDFDANAAQSDLKFCRRPPQLVALRIKEARQAMTRQYAAAVRTKKEADRAEEVELANAMHRSHGELKVKRSRLVAGQEETMQAFQVHVNGIRNSLIVKTDKKIAGFLNRMNGINHQIGVGLAQLRLSDKEICDSQPDPERMDFAVDAEMGTPVPEFRTARNSLQSRQNRTQTENQSSAQTC